MLLLGVLAAQAAGAPVAAGTYDLLETEILTGSQASVTFSSLNSTYGADYQHLQLRIASRDTRATDKNLFQIEFNSDSGSNYSAHRLLGDGSSVSSAAYTSQTSISRAGVSAGASAASNNFGATVIDILDAFETTKYTTTRLLTGVMDSVGLVELNSGLWMSTSAVDAIRLFPISASWATGSRFSLYGLRGV